MSKIQFFSLPFQSQQSSSSSLFAASCLVQLISLIPFWKSVFLGSNNNARNVVILMFRYVANSSKVVLDNGAELCRALGCAEPEASLRVAVV